MIQLFKSPNLLSLLTPLRFFNSRFIYAKEISSYLNITVPMINRELGLKQCEKCWLVGYRKINKLQNQEETIQIDHQHQWKLIKDDGFRQQLTYEQIEKFAEEQNLDIFYLDEDQKEVGLSNIQQKIYRKYYFTELFKRNSTAKKFKEIRIPQKIQLFDLNIKANKIKNMVRRGDTKIRIVTENQSDKCEQAIKKICDLLGKNDANIQVKQEKIRERQGRIPQIIIEKFSAMLDFEDEVAVDYEKVNKKWKKKKTSDRIKEEKSKIQEPSFLDTDLINQKLDVQREVLGSLRETNVNLPKGFKHYQKLEDSLSRGKSNFYELAFDKYKKKISKDDQQANFNVDEELSEDQEFEQEKQKVERRQFSEKQHQHFLGFRTINDILEDMQQIRGDQKQPDQIQQYKLKKLENQLKQALKNAGYKNQL